MTNCYIVVLNDRGYNMCAGPCAWKFGRVQRTYQSLGVYSHTIPQLVPFHSSYYSLACLPVPFRSSYYSAARTVPQFKAREWYELWNGTGNKNWETVQAGEWYGNIELRNITRYVWSRFLALKEPKQDPEWELGARVSAWLRSRIL